MSEEAVVAISVRGWHAAPCPFCGASEESLSVELIDGNTGYIVCEECQAHGPIETIDGEKAPARNIVIVTIDIWNARQPAETKREA